MTYEEAFRAFHQADNAYNDKLAELYAKRDETDHSIRQILTKNDVRLQFPEIWNEWNKTHEDLEVHKHYMDVRLVEAYESMGVKAYANKLSN